MADTRKPYACTRTRGPVERAAFRGQPCAIHGCLGCGRAVASGAETWPGTARHRAVVGETLDETRSTRRNLVCELCLPRSIGDQIRNTRRHSDCVREPFAASESESLAALNHIEGDRRTQGQLEWKEMKRVSLTQRPQLEPLRRFLIETRALETLGQDRASYRRGSPARWPSMGQDVRDEVERISDVQYR